MKRLKIITIILIVFSVFIVYALSNNFSFKADSLSYSSNSKKNSVVNEFNKKYNLSYSIQDDIQKEKEELKNIAKKTTYLLLGDFNNNKESSEHFYNRKMEFYSSRYNPTNSDNYSQIASFAIPQIFSQATELHLVYNSFGEIRVDIKDDNAFVIVSLPNVRAKEPSKTDPMKYDNIISNYNMYYIYHKQDNEWRLWYIYGESVEEVENYVNNVDAMESKKMAIVPTYESLLSKAYSFKKVNSLKDSIVKDIHEKNNNNIVYLSGYYNNKIVTSANGFFIDKGLVVTTWDFLEKSLLRAQYFTASSNRNTYVVKGIVTANPEADIAVIKVENKNKSSIKIGNYELSKIEDPVIVISSRYGTGTLVQKGILISSSNYIQTSIPLSITDAGSPVFNEKGEVIGINSSKLINSSLSIAMNSDSLKEVKEKFNNIDYDSIESVSFDSLKEKYYYIKTGNEKNYKNISDSNLEKYLKIGNIKETITLPLIKTSYVNGVVSLRYQNNISSFIDSMQLASQFKAELINEGYKEISSNKEKAVYSNNKYKIVIMEEFDYLIVVMVSL